MLITRIGINFEQPLNFVYALEANNSTTTGITGSPNNTGGNNVYLVAGRPAGSGQIERIVGPVPIASSWLTQFGNACNVINNNMTFAAATGDCTVGAGANAATGNASSTGQYTLNGCVITRFGLDVSSEQAMISNSLEIRFADLIVPAAAAGQAA